MPEVAQLINSSEAGFWTQTVWLQPLAGNHDAARRQEKQQLASYEDVQFVIRPTPASGFPVEDIAFMNILCK